MKCLWDNPSDESRSLGLSFPHVLKVSLDELFCIVACSESPRETLEDTVNDDSDWVCIRSSSSVSVMLIGGRRVSGAFVTTIATLLLSVLLLLLEFMFLFLFLPTVNCLKSGKEPLCCCFLCDDSSRRECRNGERTNACVESFLAGIKLKRRFFFGEEGRFCSKFDVEACLGRVYTGGSDGTCRMGMTEVAIGRSNTVITENVSVLNT